MKQIITMVTFGCTLLSAVATSAQYPANDSLLDAQQMDAIVAGIAFYPDPVIEMILDAAQAPEQIQAAANNVAGNTYRPSVDALRSYPALLTLLNEHLALTARLGVAARLQVSDVWMAVDRIRKAFDDAVAAQESSAPTTDASNAGTTDAATSGSAIPYAVTPAAFAAGFVTNEIVNQYQASAGNVSTTTVTGPAGSSATVTSASNGGAVTVGETTYFGGTAAGTVSTSNGNVYYGAGTVQGQATVDGNAAAYDKQSAGGVYSPTTGNYAAGTRDTSGYATTQSDGSTSFGRSAVTNVNSSAGSGQVTHSSSGVYTGTGTGSYSGSTQVTSTAGNASVSTQAADGQVNTTVTTDNGATSFTAGDGQVQHAPSQSNGTSASRYSSANAQQFEAANRAMQSSWNRLSGAGGQSWGVGTAGAARSTTDAFSRPAGQVNRGHQTAPTSTLRRSSGQSSPTRGAAPSGGPSRGRSGGRRR
ncbi:MAG: DUF3300 domain-containing protein [Planctomycetales bacterium]|nr:DUF3300 domain-containing protein [Planctomycetales bacterium]MCA9168787.1 DUF3300 domain-containing protein [Planctomycetales bacterium]